MANEFWDEETQIASDEINFGNLIDQWSKDRFSISSSLYVMHTPLALQIIGVPNLPVYISVGKLAQIIKKHPEMTLSVIKHLPRALTDPFLIFKSSTKAERIVVALNLKDSSEVNIIVPFALNVDSNGIQANIITSAYGKGINGKINYRWYVNQVITGNTLYWNKEKATAFFASAGVQFSMGVKNSSGFLSPSIKTDEDLVKIRLEKKLAYDIHSNIFKKKGENIMAETATRPNEKIKDAYARLVTNAMPSFEAAIKEFMGEIRTSMISALLEEGYERTDIRNVLESEDSFFRKMSAEEQDKILDAQIPADYIGKETGLSAINIVRKVRDQNALRIFDQTRQYDLSVVCDLLDAGYPVPDVVATLKQNSFVKEFFHEGMGDLNLYFDSVWNGVSRSRILRAGKRLEACRSAYMEQATSSMIQFKNQSNGKEGLSLFQDGRIAISLLILHRFDPKIVETVIAENSLNPQRSPEYAKELVSQAMQVKEAYDAIDRIRKTSDAKTIGDAFRFYSYHFMERRGKRILSMEDEQFILRNMAGNHIGNDQIEASYREASPVSLEPGRNRTKYLDNALHKFHARYEAQKAFSMEQYPKTKDAYLEKVKQLEERLTARNYDINRNRSYYDCLIATALLRLQFSSYNIRKVIAECSPQATKTTGNPNKTPDGYASWIVSKARNVIMREQDILFAPKIEDKKDLPLSVLIADGVTVSDLYKDAVRKIIEGHGPSDRDRMTEPHVDQQACGILLTKYPDIVLDDLADSVKMCSPRAEIAGMIQNYPQKCIEQVQVRLKEADQERSFRRTVEAEFNRSRGFEMNGIAEYGGMTIFAQSMGHAALEMKRRGIDDVAIRENLLAAAVDVPDSSLFVNRILENVRRVTERQKDIEAFVPVLDHEPNIEQKYLAFAHDIQKEVGSYQTSDDIDFVKQQLLTNKDLDIDEMNNMILAKSPIAAEPGRDEHYVEYLHEHAKDRIELENEKLRIYHPVPRQEGKESDIFKEYEYHRNTLMQNVNLPYDDRMDMYIAETLLLQGYPERDVENVIGRSPLASKEKGYGLRVVNMIRDRLDDDIDYQIIIDKGNGVKNLVNEQVRVRTIETSTTTSTDE